MDFDLFNTALKNFEKFEAAKSKNKQKHVSCHHVTTETRGGIETCTECGEILKNTIMHDREWRNYMNSGKDPNRVQKRKSDRTKHLQRRARARIFKQNC